MKKSVAVILFGLIFLSLVSFVSAECTDSDETNYYNKGNVTFGNNRYKDACVYKLEETNAQHYVKVGDILYNNLQSCSGDNCYVAEAVCSGEEQKWNIFKCNAGCKDGACVQQTNTCVEEGKTFGGYTATPDYRKCCEGLTSVYSYLKVGQDGKCNNGPTDGPDICIKCGNGICGLGENKCNCLKDCSNATVTPACKDSDGGINYYLKGVVKVNNEEVEYTDICQKDISTKYSNEILEERYCDFNNNLNTKFYTCPNGCKDGVCIKSNNTLICSDETLYGICSLTKPLYCSNGNLIQNCSFCGCDSGKVCDTQTNECGNPPDSRCGNLLYNGIASKKINFVFISDSFSNKQDFLNKVNEFTGLNNASDNLGFLNYYPYSEFKNFIIYLAFMILI